MEHIPREVTAYARHHPHLLLSDTERGGLEKWEREQCTIGLSPVDASVTNLGPWIGALNWSKPRIVVTGVCLPQGKQDIDAWRRSGPTLETAYGLDLADRVANVFGAQLLIWVIDFEHSLLTPHLEPGVVRDIGEHCVHFARRRFPHSEVVSTMQDSRRRHSLYALAMSSDSAALYPRGPRATYGKKRPELWDAVAYLACGATIAVAAERKPVLAVVDHDQARSVGFASALAGRLGFEPVGGLFYWPPPQLGWRPPSRGQGVEFAAQFLSLAMAYPRRAYRAKSPEARLNLNDDEEAVLRKLHSADTISETAIELIDYAGGGQFDGDPVRTREAASASIADALRRLAANRD